MLAVPLLVSLLLGACGSEPPAERAGDEPGAPGRGAAQETSARAQLAALAAAAEDRRFAAFYTLSTAGAPDRTVAVTLAADGSWRVDVPDWALGGTVDVSVTQTSAGLFQCVLPSADRPYPAACVRVADPGGELPADADPRVQHVFTDWLRVLSDRQAPLAVSIGQLLPGATGTCFAVELTSVSLNPLLEVGIYCFDADGTLTAVRVASGTLVLAGSPAAAPPSVALPGPVVAGEPLGMGPLPAVFMPTAPTLQPATG